MWACLDQKRHPDKRLAVIFCKAPSTIWCSVGPSRHLFTNGTKLAEHISNQNRSLNSHVRTEEKKLIVNHTFARREFLENHVKSERSKWIIVIVRRELKGQCIIIISSLLSATAGSPQATLFLLGVQASVTVHAFWALTGQAPGSREWKKWHTF